VISCDALGALRRVRVGSLNGPKIEAVRAALGIYLDAPEVEGVPVESGVSEQPVGFEEIVRGARNRAGAAARSGACDLAVGIEDGLVPLPASARADSSSRFWNLGCAVVTDGRRESAGFSSGFAYPEACVDKAARERVPIGGLFDRLWADYAHEEPDEPSALSVGNVGRLTLGALPRSEYARHAVLCALVPFLHPSLYFGAEAGS
jgi:inosine/xanthosine triphosphatase